MFYLLQQLLLEASIIHPQHCCVFPLKFFSTDLAIKHAAYFTCACSTECISISKSLLCLLPFLSWRKGLQPFRQSLIHADDYKGVALWILALTVLMWKSKSIWKAHFYILYGKYIATLPKYYKLLVWQGCALIQIFKPFMHLISENWSCVDCHYACLCVCVCAQGY